MGLDAYQAGIVAEHYRRTIDTSTRTSTTTKIGDVRLFGDPTTFDVDTADGIAVPVPNFAILYHKRDAPDLQQGDILKWSGVVYEVSEVRPAAFPIPQYVAEAQVKRMNVPDADSNF